MQWYYSKNATQLGPVADAELRAKLASGEVSAADMVWREGMRDWLPVSAVAELNSVRPNPVSGPSGGVGASPYAPPGVPGGMVVASGSPQSGMAIASLVCGILGLVTCTFFPGIPAVILGHVALKRIADPAARLEGRGMAIAGLILGYLGIVVFVGSILLMILGLVAGMVH